MLRYTDYSDAELLDMTPEQVDTLIDLECAYLGLPLLTKEPTLVTFVSPETDVVIYEVGGLDFFNADDAQKILTTIQTCKLSKEGYTGSRVANKVEPLNPGAYDYPSIKSKHLFSEARWNEVKSEATAAAKLKADYESEKEAYKKLVDQRQEAADSVTEHIASIRANRRRLAEAEGYKKRYLELAGGDLVVAERFFQNAFPLVHEEFGALLFAKQIEAEATESEASAI